MKFYYDVREKLQHRIEGFDCIFNYLKIIQNPIIVETGCMRNEDNYCGDGQSSFLFDRYVNEYGGEFYTVDLYPRRQKTQSPLGAGMNGGKITHTHYI